MTNSQLTLQLFLQIAVVLAVCQAVGWVGRRWGQPSVVAEMLAGVVLGPSVVGLLWPHFSDLLFPRESMKVLFPISQLGLAMYMFIVGLEFRVDIVRRRLRSVVAVSLVGMAAPFALGALLAWYFHRHTDLFPGRVNLVVAMLFLGAAMCITAFPVLARIIEFKKLQGTVMGAVALGAGAMNDTAAWALLALVLASFDSHFSHAFLNIAAGVAYVCVAMLLVRPLLERWARGIERRGRMSEVEFTFCMVLLALGAWFTDVIGLHAVFGAFIMGVAMPRGIVVRLLTSQLHSLTVGVLLPLFFAYSGLNTQMGLLNTPQLWVLALLVLVAAIVGKGVACCLAASATGLSRMDSLGIGALMNTRGLMELILLNIGLQRGIITPALFAILVIMALVTTFMTSPVFDWLVGHYQPAQEPAPEPAALEIHSPNTTTH